MNRLNCDVAIIGGGPAGLAAAVAAYQENPNLSIIVLERDRELGGILNQCIHKALACTILAKNSRGRNTPSASWNRCVRPAWIAGQMPWCSPFRQSAKLWPFRPRMDWCISRQKPWC